MKKMKDIILNLSLLLTIPLLSIVYGLLNNPNRGVYSLVTDIDRIIPFNKFFIIPYVLWYFYIFIVFIYFFFKDKKLYHKTLLAYNLGMIACFIIYYLFQTTTPRPVLNGNDFFTKLIFYIYSNDQPFNCFPSIHSLSSYLMIAAALKLEKSNKWVNILIGTISLLIILSTLFIKQHVLLDALSAIILGDIIFKLVNSCEGAGQIWKEKLFSLLMMKEKLEI